MQKEEEAEEKKEKIAKRPIIKYKLVQHKSKKIPMPAIEGIIVHTPPQSEKPEESEESEQESIHSDDIPIAIDERPKEKKPGTEGGEGGADGDDDFGKPLMFRKAGPVDDRSGTASGGRPGAKTGVNGARGNNGFDSDDSDFSRDVGSEGGRTKRRGAKNAFG